MAKRMLLSYSDLEMFPDDGQRREVLGGELFVTPSPSPRHQRAVTKLWAILDAYARANGGEAFVAPLDVVFSEHDVAEPDVIYLAADKLSSVGDTAIETPPSLIVEVLSPTTSKVDRTKKREIYAVYGVPEYWIVDIDAQSIERNADPRGGKYHTIEIFEDAMPAATLTGLRLRIAELVA